MVDYVVVGTFEYDNFGGFWTESPIGLSDLTSSPITYMDADSTFALGEDLTGGGNNYIGFINIDGVDYPVVTGGAMIRQT